MLEDCKTVYISILPVGGATAETLIRRWDQEADRVHAGKRRVAATQRRSFLARSMLRDLLQHMTELPGQEWQLGTDARGQPWASHSSSAPGIAVSITHSGEYVAVAATRLGSIGIDIERHVPERRFSEIAETAFGPEFAGISDAGAFYRLWCLREATGKATGDGLASDLDLAMLTRDSPARGAWSRRVTSRTWLLAHLEPVAAYSLAVGILAPRGAAPAGWSLDSLAWRHAPDKPAG